jgi:hypothetical protein
MTIMPDEIVPTTPQAGDDGQPQAGTPPTTPEPTGQEPKTFDAAYVQRLRNEAAESRKARQELEARLKTIEDANLSETERTKKRADEAEARASKLEKDLMRTKIAVKHGLPEVLAERLMGDDETAMDADAKVLAKLMTPAASSGSATNGASNRAERQLTADDARKMTPTQIQQAMDKGLFNAVLGRST